VDVGEEVVRVAIDAENLRLVVGVLFLKGRTFPPKRTCDDVRLAVAIDVADGGTFGIEIAMGCRDRSKGKNKKTHHEGVFRKLSESSVDRQIK
jgi:hypothetical protein